MDASSDKIVGQLDTKQDAFSVEIKSLSTNDRNHPLDSPGAFRWDRSASVGRRHDRFQKPLAI